MPEAELRASVIVPCHNAGRYIADALRSAAAQTLPAHQIIVINDASSDDSLEQIERSGVMSRPGAMLLHANARSAAHARNVGIEAATGDWIAFLDADDLWYPTHLERAAKLLAGEYSGNDVAFIANHHFLEGDEAREIHADLRPKIDAPASGLTAAKFLELCARGFHFGHSTVLLRRDRVSEVGGFDLSQKRRHDFDLWLRVIRGRTWAYDTHPHARYRLDSPGSISKSVVNAEYFFLRALVKNRQGLECPAMDQLIRTAARRAMSLSFVDGTWDDFCLARGLAWPYLKPRYRWFYRAGAIAPPVFRAAIRLKRRLVMGNRN